ncbi:TetR/AcrR family transcriptional regulator [Kribbella sp. NPDC058245]|uniref:TetR/AcrR family transcriptional regulator n=1 Tax=Kribbella sp. NPDC058245 TaxID=3346399 RepID=UPI0036ED00CF
MATDTTRPALRVDIKRPQRADARRNFDALLTAARDAFATRGVEASLEEIARQAGVGIGTLYRNFPTRQDLLNAVYFGEIEELCIAAEDVADLPPWEALTSWLQRFVAYVATKRAIWESLNRDTDSFREARAAMYAAGTPLFERAQAAGEARTDVSFDDLLRMVNGLTGAGFVDDAQRDRVLQIALDGVRAR